MHSNFETIGGRLREIAEELDCFCEADVEVLTGYTPKTLEVMRKRGTIPFAWVGKNRFYPRKHFTDVLAGTVPGPRANPTKEMR